MANYDCQANALYESLCFYVEVYIVTRSAMLKESQQKCILFPLPSNYGIALYSITHCTQLAYIYYSYMVLNELNTVSNNLIHHIAAN